MASRKKEYAKLLIVLGVIILILGSFITYLSIPYFSQKSIILATEPVDPFDPLRGQYIIIGYEIGRIPKIPKANFGDKIYVSVIEDESGIWRYDSSSLSKPSSGDFIKGTIKSIPEYGNEMSVEYGIEQYFFERGASFNTRGMNVEVKLSSSGRAVITRLLDEDLKPLEITYEEKSWLS